MRKIYTSIDIGSDTIKFVVGELLNDNINILSSNTIKSKGVRKGLIFDPNLTINAIKDGIKEINDDLGVEIKKVIVNVPNYNAKFMFVTGSVEINNEDEIVTTEDINKVIKNSVYSKLAIDYELVTVLPVEFLLDNEVVDKPVLKKGKKLELKGIMVSVPKKNIYSVLNVVEGAGLEVVEITLSGIADYFEIRNNNTDKKVGAIINLGHETTTVSVINKGKLMNTETIQLGGLNVEKDLSYIFNINIFDARTLKEKFASSHKRFCQLNDVYEIKNTVGEILKLNQLEVSEVVMSRLSEILELAKKQILLLTKQSISYIILTGGLTEIKAFKNLAFEIFGKSVIIYSMDTLGVRDNKYTTSLGMIKYFCDKMDMRGREYSMMSTEDVTALVTPSSKTKKDNMIFTKFIENFITNKEEK